MMMMMKGIVPSGILVFGRPVLLKKLEGQHRQLHRSSQLLFSEIKKWAEMKKPAAAPASVSDENTTIGDDEYEDMFVDTSVGREWGGPMRGGRFPEPTRFGDWERKGRTSDF